MIFKKILHSTSIKKLVFLLNHSHRFLRQDETAQLSVKGLIEPRFTHVLGTLSLLLLDPQ